MAVPLYRPTGQSRRTVRSQQQFDHDVFEGLPIRRWDKQWMWFAKKNIPPPPPPELPLPKETHLLTPMSQTLLKAARNGTLGQQPKEGEELEAEKKRLMPASTRLFKTNKWAVIPRENEPAEPEYLGRPPDTFSRHSRLVKKTVNGKVMIVEEELEDVFPDPLLAGVAADGTTASPAHPVKRRPPPPKRKPGRGRKPGFKKMVTFSEDGRALPTGEAHATPSGTVGSGADNGDGEGDGEDDVEMGDAEDGTPDDQDNEGEDGEGEPEAEVQPTPPVEKTATPEVTGAIKKEGTVEPMDIASPPPTTSAAAVPTVAPIAEAIVEKLKSPTPVPEPIVVDQIVEDPKLEEPAPEPVVEEAPAPPKEPSPVPAPAPVEVSEPPAPVVEVVETEVPAPEPVVSEPITSEPIISEPIISEPIVSEPIVSEPPAPEPAPSEPAPTVKSPTPQPAPPVAAPVPVEVGVEAEPEKVASPPVNPLKRKSPPDDNEGELVDKDLDKHEVSIAAAIAERESHDETLSPAPPPLAPSA
ncbi:hypothetical protein H072_9612 [Dactylellina haptotyla CBS 200.50]|uniref:Uncharacterized protein n=1 Tax=Dactylellina haptotyla (strain CBS 200.50) TaxID=1284197 RepID=S8A272_DACHA|nr:hypothetical protein H072_9612 [Dactylellina haptotyla CBS 200.50]